MTDAVERMRHVANEWADAATNGLQWLKNIRDGISLVDEAISNMESDIKHCLEVQSAAFASPAAESAAVQPDAMVAAAQVSELIAIEPEYPSATLADVDRLIAEARETGASDSEIVLTAMRQVVRDTKASILKRVDAFLPVQPVSDEPVAWLRMSKLGKSSNGATDIARFADEWRKEGFDVRPLYTRPQSVKEVVEALRGMLAHSCVADAGGDMKTEEDHEAERRARAALASLSQEQG